MAAEGERMTHYSAPITTQTRTGVMAVVAAVVAAMLATLPTLPADAAPPEGPDKLADFEGGVPAGWFEYVGATTVAPTVVTASDTDPQARPAQAGDNDLLQIDYDVADFGGVGQDLDDAFGGPQDWSTTEGFSFWFFGTGSGLTYQAEISENRSDPGSDTSERFDYAFVDATPGWQRITIPWADFTRATDFQPGGAPDDGFTLTEVWAWAIVLPVGADTVYVDDVGVDNHVVDDFENLPLGTPPSGNDADGLGVGYLTFAGSGSSVAAAVEDTPPAPVTTEFGEGNAALKVDMDVDSFAGVVHAFSNEALDEWVSQDWTAWEGLGFWLHGQGSGTGLFIDLIENRNPDSSVDDAERWSVTLADDFVGWRYFEIPFSDFNRKDIGNGAPNDGFTRQEMHGWAFGALNTPSPQTWYLDGMSLYGDAGALPLTVSLTAGIVRADEGTAGEITVALNRAMVEGDPAQVTVEYATEPGTATPDRDYVPASGTFTFEVGGPREQTFSIETFDNSKRTGDKRVSVRISDPTNADFGTIRQSSLLIVDTDPFDPNLLDDFEGPPYLWDASNDVDLASRELTPDDPLAVPGQGEYEGVLEATVPTLVPIAAPPTVCSNGESSNKGRGKSASNAVVPVSILSTEDFDALTVDHSTVRLGEASETHVNKKTGEPRRHVSDVNDDGLDDLQFHFRVRQTGLDCDDELVITGETRDGRPITSASTGAGTGFGRDFALGQDWSEQESLQFWYYGTGSGDPVTVQLKDNRAPDPGPDGWDLVWSDEFDDPAGTPPNPENWGYEIGDVTPDGKFGWGNEERQYYTDDPDNAATDGDGNLVITLAEPDSSLECYYGPCEYTSARLVTQDRQEFAYGRIETRLQVPDGGAGLWPAFWSLGTDITYNPWPGAGEIDVMEYVSRLPNEIFGTIHGPGYAGGASFGNVVDLGEPVASEYHTFTVEWEPNNIRWYFDGVQYHEATPEDVAPNPWVFEKPFFLLLNMAVGGNFGGAIDPALELPQELAVDYVRVYQGPDTAERFETSFVDDFTGWQQVTVPLTGFTRSADQPEGAPDDGLGLTDVWGYGFGLPGGSATGSVFVDQVRLVPKPPPTEVMVANADDSGPGSLRAALAKVAEAGTVTFDPALAGATVDLTSPIVVAKDVTVDGSDAPGLTLSGGNADRVLVVEPETTATVRQLTLTEGYGFQLAGGVLNNGDLTLDHVTVTNNTMTTDVGDFWQGGGGIYNGDGASLTLVDSTVSDNASGWSGGGVYSFFNTTTVIERSSISGNTAADTGGGLRLLGDATMLNSTVSGNSAVAWHGGALFQTDGSLTVTNSTLADNTSPGGTGALFVGTFGSSAASVTLVNTVLANPAPNCFAGYFGDGTVELVSGGHNIATDDSCNLTAPGDQPSTDPLLESLAENGGPTLTHAPQAGSPAIDAADAADAPAVDQRGVARPQGAGPDIGSVERQP
jgi:beta-glucanase (GH16 family)